MTKNAISMGIFGLLLASCSSSDSPTKPTQSCSGLYEQAPTTGELRILMVNQARTGEEIYVSNFQCSDFQSGLQLTSNARGELASLIGVDDEGGIHAGIYLVDLDVTAGGPSDRSSKGDQIQGIHVSTVNSMVADIGLDGMAAAFGDEH